MAAKAALQRFEEQDAERNQYIENLIQELDRARIDNDRLRTDLAVEIAIQEQSQLGSLGNHQPRARLSHLEERVRQSAYVLVLLDADADGYVFDDSYLEMGVEGGISAAIELRNGVKAKVIDRATAGIHATIMVRAFASTEGLASVLERSPTTATAEQVTPFMHGFNQAEFCDYVLVGNEQCKANEKIKALFEYSLRDPCCMKIVLGAHFDEQFRRLLRENGEVDLGGRVLLLNTHKHGSGIRPAPYWLIEVPGLFRSLEPQAQQAQILPVNPFRVPSQGITGISAKSIRHTSMTPLAINRGASITTLQIAASVNSLGQRLDRELSKPGDTAVGSYKQKLAAGKRFCNEHFLRGQCLSQGCKFKHDGLGSDELVVLKQDKRMLLCGKGLMCRDPGCYYGHECQKSGCKGKNCMFSVAMHNVSRV